MRIGPPEAASSTTDPTSDSRAVIDDDHLKLGRLHVLALERGEALPQRVRAVVRRDDRGQRQVAANVAAWPIHCARDRRYGSGGDHGASPEAKLRPAASSRSAICIRPSTPGDTSSRGSSRDAACGRARARGPGPDDRLPRAPRASPRPIQTSTARYAGTGTSTAYEFPRYSFPQRVALERHNAAELGRHLSALQPDVVTLVVDGVHVALADRAGEARSDCRPCSSSTMTGSSMAASTTSGCGTWRGPRRSKVAPAAARVCGIPTDVDVNSAGTFRVQLRVTRSTGRATFGSRLHLRPSSTPGSRTASSSPLAPQPWAWRLVYVGRIDRQKGIDTAIASLAHLPPAATLTV